MEAMGRLAGGVAHDFNNLLTIINGYSDLLLQKMPHDDGRRGLVEEIHQAGQRSASLTRQLLSFSRKQVVIPRPLDLNVIVADTERLLRRVIGEDVELHLSLTPNLGLVRADKSQIEQVLLNLAVNARDAMPEGGKLSIGTASVDFDGGHPGVHAGSFVTLAVSDTGCGMTPEVRARVFEPFFTTKEPGKGTGLGLAVVHGIVLQSGGHAEVHSEPGIGTTFKVYLPRLDDPSARAGGSSMRAGVPPSGTETILLAEDEVGVRAFSRHVLASRGYSVLEAGDGNEAIRIAGDQRPIHLLVTDVVMPGPGGQKVAERIRELHPEAKVLFLSGYTDDAIVHHGVLHDRVHFLHKPFSPLALACKVRDVLDGRPPVPLTCVG
jgi:CheY-like chemotaxis protein